jgi:hypothetical protein
MAEYEVDKWYGWNGGIRPVHMHTRVEVKYSDMGAYDCDTAISFNWGGPETDGSIAAFRIVTPYVEPAKPIECWINVYPVGDQYGSHYPTQEEAVRGAANGVLRQAFMREVLP